MTKKRVKPYQRLDLYPSCRGMAGWVTKVFLSSMCDYRSDSSHQRLLLMDKTFDTKEKTPQIIMVTGGQRGGKSVFAENMALDRSPHPTYLATARVFDDEMRKRVKIHQKRRGGHWRNIEAPLSIEALEFSSRRGCTLSIASPSGQPIGCSIKRKYR